jgi:ferredoxin
MERGRPLAEADGSYLSPWTLSASPMTYRVKINRGLCTGYAECVGIAPEVFALDKDNLCVVLDPEAADDEDVDEYEDQIWPA